ncbi:MAG: glycosyltransferase family 9 protein [Opitutaceae bacterium]|nr:glycosyltransferase family 9 protein [Cytophagales bacterium]
MEKGNASLHLLDRYFGIPLIVILGLLRLFKRKIKPGFKPKRIAILNISSIGDNILMSGQVADLHKKFPGSEIRIFCGETNFGLVKLIPNVVEVIKLPVTNVKESVHVITNQQSFDLMIDFGPWPRLNSLYAAFFKATIKIGFKSKGQWRHYVYDYAILHSNKKHEIDNFRALLEPLGIQSKLGPFLQAPEFSSGLKLPYIIFHPWPGGYKSFMKEWPKNNWLDLAEKMANLGYEIFISGSKDDVNASKRMADDSYGVLQSIAGKYNLAETCSLLKEASLLVSVNTGIMHLGAAMGTKLVALNGPTSVSRWGPVSDKAITVLPPGDECGYLNYGFEYHLSKVNCMELISVNAVYGAVQKQLKTL